MIMKLRFNHGYSTEGLMLALLLEYVPSYGLSPNGLQLVVDLY